MSEYNGKIIHAPNDAVPLDFVGLPADSEKRPALCKTRVICSPLHEYNPGEHANYFTRDESLVSCVRCQYKLNLNPDVYALKARIAGLKAQIKNRKAQLETAEAKLKEMTIK